MEIQVSRHAPDVIVFATAPVGVPLYIVGNTNRIFMKIKLEGSHGSSSMLVDLRTGLIVHEHSYIGASFKEFSTHTLNLEL